MWSNADRAGRAWRMGEWALLHQVRADGSSKPRDPSRFAPDRGSSLDLDDRHFLPELGANLVSSTARITPTIWTRRCRCGQTDTAYLHQQ